MAHLSKKKLRPEIESAIEEHLLAFLSSSKSKEEARILSEELLTKTERLMLGKRLATIVMLARGYTFDQISEALAVSPQTISRVWKEFMDGEHEKLVRYTREYTKEFKKDSLWGVFEKALSLNEPRRGRRID